MSEVKPLSHSEEPLDISEKGLPQKGVPQSYDKRLFMQLQVFTGSRNTNAVIGKLKDAHIQGVVYHDISDPFGIGILTITEHPSDYTDKIRDVFHSTELSMLKLRTEFTMLGRTYSSGYEPDLEDWLLKKPRRTALNPKWPWAVWYPLRRKPEFAILSRDDQKRILMEHAVLGRQYGNSNLAYDIRLSCYGIDQNDNEFVIGVVSSELYPLSRLIQDMRKTEQTSKYIQNLGPFFVGKAVWQSPYTAA